MTTGKDSHLTSLTKTVTWYCSDAVLTGTIAFTVTRDLEVSLGIALLQQTSEIVLYYFHERVWVKVQAPWGGQKAQTD